MVFIKAALSTLQVNPGFLRNAKHSYYNGSAEGHEYPDLQVGDEVNPRPVFVFSYD
jgi:hypothetical protein